MAKPTQPTGRDRPTVPTERDIAVTTPQTPMLDHSFTLQAIMELQKSVAELAIKTERLIADVERQGLKIEGISPQISFVKGALWVISGLIVFAFTGIALYLRIIPPH
jgi:hypothetical protein